MLGMWLLLPHRKQKLTGGSNEVVAFFHHRFKLRFGPGE